MIVRRFDEITRKLFYKKIFLKIYYLQSLFSKLFPNFHFLRNKFFGRPPVPEENMRKISRSDVNLNGEHLQCKFYKFEERKKLNFGLKLTSPLVEEIFHICLTQVCDSN